jgi:superfamily II DNA or RNA helicase
LALNRQREIISYLLLESKIIGFTATPERLSGEGLSTKSGGVYDEIIIGPSIPELTAGGFLAQLRYFSPPLDGLDKIKVDRFGEYDDETLERLFE